MTVTWLNVTLLASKITSWKLGSVGTAHTPVAPYEVYEYEWQECVRVVRVDRNKA